MVRKNIRQQRACELVGLPRSSLSYRPHPKHDERLIRTLAREHPRWGCRRVHATLRREGVQVNRKTVHRLWKSEALALPTRRKTRKICAGQHIPLRAEQPNQVWTYDFVFDQTLTGQPLKILTLTDEFTRQSLALRCGPAFTSVDVKAGLVKVMRERGVPSFLRSDNGPEFIAHDLKVWLAVQEVGTRYIDPGQPWQNGVAESFHVRLRDELLNAEVFHLAQHAVGRLADVLQQRQAAFFSGLRPTSSPSDGSSPLPRPPSYTPPESSLQSASSINLGQSTYFMSSSEKRAFSTPGGE